MKIIAALLSFFIINFTAQGSGTANSDNSRIVDFLMEYESMSEAQIRESLESMSANDIQSSWLRTFPIFSNIFGLRKR